VKAAHSLTRSNSRQGLPSVSIRNAAAAQITFFASIGVDLSALTPMEQTAAKMKARRLMQLSDENSQLEVTVQQKSLQVGGAIPANASYFVKVIDEVSDEIQIIRVTTSSTVDELSAVIGRRIQRDAELMLITGDDGTKEPITSNVLRVLQASVLARAKFALTVAAL
jgi:hypothetical protein